MSDVTAPLSDRSPTDSVADYPCGTRFGRYVILESVGSGGAGTVYAAFDPHLDRRVALKLLHEGRGFKALLAEARTLARLTHPNVVTVHDVGSHDDKVFVAMELVDGDDLGTWLEQASRDTGRILDIFLQAGRGLEAAHRRGIIHRDFKPRNVLLQLGNERAIEAVKVGDFGLAQPTHGAVVTTRDDDGAASGSEWGGSDTDPPPGVHGTPVYMAPEQHEGGAVDARTDQYSFCLSLWEALTGSRPFEGTLFALAEAKRNGAPQWPGDDATPRWLVRLIVRGLAPRPADRWSSMTELLSRLQAGDPRRRVVRRIGWGAAAISLVSMGALAGPFARDSSKRCSGARVELEPVWSDTRRAEIEKAMRSVPSSMADDTTTRVLEGIDGYATGWSEMHRTVCEATARGEQSSEVLDAGMACLRGRLGALDALVGVLEDPDPDVLAHAVRAVSELPEVASCRDPERDDSGIEPSDPLQGAQRAEVEQIRHEMARVDAISSAGRYAEAWAAAQPVLEQGEKIEHPPLHAELALLQGRLQLKNGELDQGLESLERAYAQGLRSSHLEVATDAAIALASVHVHDFEDHESSMQWARHARPLAERDGVNNRRVARIRIDQAGALRVAGQYEAALSELQQARAMLDEIVEPDDGMHESVLVGLGHVYMAMSKFSEALEVYRQAKEHAVKTLGEQHPAVAKRLNDMGMALSKLEKFDESIEVLRDSLARIEHALGPEHPNTATMKLNLAAALGNDDRTDRTDEAVALLQEALEIDKRVYGEDSLKLYRPLLNLATLYKQRRDPKRALGIATDALALQERALGKEHPALCDTLLNLASIYMWLGQYDDVEATYQRMLGIAELGFDRPHPDVAEALLGLANNELARDDYQGALELYERASREYEALGPEASGKVTMILGGRAIALDSLGRKDDAGRLYFQATQRGFAGSNLTEWERAMVELRAGKWLWTHPAEHPEGRARAVELVQAALADAKLAKDWGLDYRADAEAWLRKHKVPG